jgi:membrane-associated phospholipid phosphatase
MEAHKNFFKGVLKSSAYFVLCALLIFGTVYLGMAYKVEIMEAFSMLKGAALSTAM